LDSGLVIGLVVLLVGFGAAWLVSLALRDASVVDPLWGPAFAVVAWVYALTGEAPPARRWAVVGMVTLWGVRLGVHLWLRNHGVGEDFRYRAMRARAPRAFPWVSLVTVFWLQAAIAWMVSVPLWGALRPARPTSLTALDLAGLAVFAVGLTIETVADLQLARFRRDPSRRGTVLDGGLWRYSRHPNYFGDAVVWWGLWLPAAAVGAWWTAVGPALMTFLLVRVSGVALLEKTLARTKPQYREYVRRTSAFVPWPPRRG